MNITPTTYRINIAMAKLGVSRSTLYRLVDRGHLELIKISARASGITATSFAAYIEQQQAAARASA
jgi:predicted DNA-binding transcriptional regulator AlpA